MDKEDLIRRPGPPAGMQPIVKKIHISNEILAYSRQLKRGKVELTL
jgi:hypothetical protein